MKKIGIILLLLIGAVSSCEVILEFPEEREKSVLVLNAIVDTDSTFSAFVSRSLPSDSVYPGNLFYGYDDILYGDMSLSGLYEDFNMKKHAIQDVKVLFQVNNGSSQIMYYDSLLMKYRCDYVPREGDKVNIWCENQNYEIISAETLVPKKQKIEVLNVEKIYSESPDCECTDTIIRIDLNITDPGNENNYYRLKIRSASGFYEDLVSDNKTSNGYQVIYKNRYRINDYYTSTDPLFYDEYLYKGDGVWPAHFSTIFDDRLIDGKSYSFTVEIREVLGNYMDSAGNTYQHNNPYLYIELVSITEDMYKYMKSMMNYRISEGDPYAELSKVYTNIEGGFGILGASSSTDIYFPLF